MASVFRLTILCHNARTSIPSFLCPFLVSSTGPILRNRKRHLRLRPTQTRPLHAGTAARNHVLPTPTQLLELPRSCPGCGAFSQILSPDQPGFYSINRKSVKAFVARHEQAPSSESLGKSELETFERIVSNADTSVLSQMGLGAANVDGRRRSPTYYEYSTCGLTIMQGLRTSKP